MYKYIIFTLCILGFWVCIFPIMLVRIVPIVCDNLSYNSQYDINIEEPKIYFNIIPVAHIKAKSFVVKSKNGDDDLYLNNINLKIRILPLLSGRIHINKIQADNIKLYLLMDTKAELDKNFISTFKKTKVKCDSIDIKNIDIKILQKESKQKAVFLTDKFSFDNNGRHLKLNIHSKFNINDAVSEEKINIYYPKQNNNLDKSTINVYILNFDIAPITEYFKNYLPKDFISAHGKINTEINNHHVSAILKDFAVNMQDESNSMIFPKEISLISDFSVFNNSVTISKAEIKSNNIDVVINGIISNYLNKPIPSYNLKICLNKSKIEDFINLLPPFKTEDVDMYKLKKYKFYGNIIGNLSIKGEDLEPSINGNVYVSEGILTKPIANAKGANIKLNFKDKYLNYDVTVPAGDKEKVFVQCGVELYNEKYADIHVWSTKNVDLSVAEEKVVPLHEILNFIIGPVPIMDIKGLGNIDITIKGNRKYPHIWGFLNLRDVTAYFTDMPDLVLKNAYAMLKFDDENVTFNLEKGFTNGKNVNIDGVSTLSGKFDFDAVINNQSLFDLYKAIKSSNIVNEVKNVIPNVELIHGPANLTLKIYGNIKDIENIKFNKNFFTKGRLELLGNTFNVQGITIDNTKGTVDFNNMNANMRVISYIGDCPLDVFLDIKDKYAELKLTAQKLNLRNVINKNDEFTKNLANIYVKIRTEYKGRIDKIEYDKINFEAQMLGAAANNKLNISEGKILLKNNKLYIKDLRGFFNETKSSFNIDLFADNVSKNPSFSGNIQLNDFNLFLINSLKDFMILPKNIRDIISLVNFKNGKINLKARLLNNSINASTNIGGVEFIYTPLELPVKVINGSIYIRKNYLGLNKINLVADNMPILIDGGINNIFTNQDFDLYINSKPVQNFVDKYINNNHLYPIKLRGDIVYWLKLKGKVDNFYVESQTNMAKDSSIYYLGAMINDLENSIILSLNMNVINKNILKIKEFSYDKLIDSQGKKQTKLNMLKANGEISLLSNDLLFRNLKIKTSHPTDVRILNIVFRKPNIKQGQFTSDLKLNGKMSAPHLVGNFDIVETDIPFFETTMKKLSFVFNDKTIELSSKGEVLGNDIRFKGTLKNKLVPPFYVENAELYTKDIDMNYITNQLKDAQANEITPFNTFESFNIKSTVIKHLKILADSVKLRNITATNVEAHVSLNDKKVFNIEKVKFNVAKGSIDGRFSYNLLNDNTWINLNAKNIDANDMAYALFDLNNQIYGDLTGNVRLSCNGSDFSKCMETLNGSVNFDVIDGKMPKLGSLEYLLKAGNLVKGGLTGVSLNNIIDILIPLKTGNFSEIYGVINVNKGITRDVEISTRGNDLSLFITGSYNFATSNAEMEVLGLLSKNISTMLGPIGNVSLNTLFNVVPGIDLAKDSALINRINKIPGIELNSKAFRKFIAEINGNINGDNYVKSFKWIN